MPTLTEVGIMRIVNLFEDEASTTTVYAPAAPRRKWISLTRTNAAA